MARDCQLPSFLAKISARHGVPTNAILLVAGLSIAIGGYLSTCDDGISLLVSLINFGALTAFLALHVAVLTHYVVRGGSRNLVAHTERAPAQPRSRRPRTSRPPRIATIMK